MCHISGCAVSGLLQSKRLVPNQLKPISVAYTLEQLESNSIMSNSVKLLEQVELNIFHANFIYRGHVFNTLYWNSLQPVKLLADDAITTSSTLQRWESFFNSPLASDLFWDTLAFGGLALAPPWSSYLWLSCSKYPCFSLYLKRLKGLISFLSQVHFNLKRFRRKDHRSLYRLIIIWSFKILEIVWFQWMLIGK